MIREFKPGSPAFMDERRVKGYKFGKFDPLNFVPSNVATKLKKKAKKGAKNV